MSYLSNKKLNELITLICENPLQFGIHSPLYRQWAQQLPAIIDNLYQGSPNGQFDLALFGKIDLPFVSFGNINSAHLFGLDEIILFVFYWNNRHRYNVVYDLGANIGLHTIMLSQCNYTVHCFEPDPNHIAILERNLEKNQCHLATIHRSAVYSDDNDKAFVRVVGNTTGSHLTGMKKDPYGDLNTFKVKCTAFTSILAQLPSLIKMDIEGAEADVICTTQHSDWLATDMLLEVGTAENAQRIFTHMSAIGMNLFSQKCGWQAVAVMDDIPTSYKEGSLFISSKDTMPW